MTLTCIEDVAVLIFWVHAVSEKLSGLIVAQLFTEGLQGVFQLSAEHGAVLLFVVQFETLHEVLEAALVLLGSDLDRDKKITSPLGFFSLSCKVNCVAYLSEDWKEFLDCEFLLTTLLGGAHLLAQVECWVAVQGSQDVGDVIGIDLACAVAVIDAEREFCVCERGRRCLVIQFGS